MQLRTKIILLFVLITGLAVGTMTGYSAYQQRTTYITTELETQKQVLSLLHNAVSVQFYSFTYEQLQSSLTIRSELKARAFALHDRIDSLKRSVQQLYSVDLYQLPKDNDRSKWTEQERQAELSLVDYLRYEQQLLNKQGTDLVVTRNNELFLAPTNPHILTGLAVSLSHLLPIMHSSNSEYSAGYFLTLFNSNHPQDSRPLDAHLSSDEGTSTTMRSWTTLALLKLSFPSARPHIERALCCSMRAHRPMSATSSPTSTKTTAPAPTPTPLSMESMPS